MELYLIYIDDKKHSQCKNYEISIERVEKLIEENPSSCIKILLEEFCEFGHSDTCSKLHLLYEYKNNVVKKYI